MAITNNGQDLEPELLTDKADTKVLSCRSCGRPCIVTTFASAAKTVCSKCRTEQEIEASYAKHRKRLEQSQKTRAEKDADLERAHIKRARKVDPADLADLRDAIINPKFRQTPLCPFNPDHGVELKSVCHTPNYGPRHFMGYKDGLPIYEQETGESVAFQCNECYTVISFSTMHPVNLRSQNEARAVHRSTKTPGLWESMLGAREETSDEFIIGPSDQTEEDEDEL